MEAKNEPFNCFLMGQNTSIIPNEMDFEIVALCLSKMRVAGLAFLRFEHYKEMDSLRLGRDEVSWCSYLLALASLLRSSLRHGVQVSLLSGTITSVNLKLQGVSSSTACQVLKCRTMHRLHF